MPDLSIREFGDPMLRSRAAAVEYENSSVPSRVQQLIEQMYHRMDQAQGIGLAAPQVGVGLRIFTWSVRGNRGAVINPELEYFGEPAEIYDDDPERPLREGCLSIPQADIHAPVSRYPQVLLRGLDSEGAELEVPAKGLLAACFQHELDHLNGMLFIDRLVGDEKKRIFRMLRGAQV